MSQTENQKPEKDHDECINSFEEILILSENMPLVHEKKMSVEDTIRELTALMPEGWVYTEA